MAAIGLKMIYLLSRKDTRDDQGWKPIRTYATEEMANSARSLREAVDDEDHILFSVQPIELEG